MRMGHRFVVMEMRVNRTGFDWIGGVRAGGAYHGYAHVRGPSPHEHVRGYASP
jgi:hypothetical protein